MDIVLSYVHYPCSAPKYFKSALRELGHRVISVGGRTGGRLPWMPDVDFSQYNDEPDIVINEQIYPIESVLEKTGEVDLFIQMDANQFFVGKPPIPNVVYAIDNHVAKYDATEFDFFFGAHSWAYGSDRINFHWLPCAYSPKDHFEKPGDWKTLDASFVGVVYENRNSLIQELSKYGKIGIGMGVLGEEYNNAYNQARIGLCLSCCGDLPMRVFENAAMGLMIFCDRQKDLDKLGMIDGAHYIGFDNLPDAVDKFKLLMQDPATVKQIAQQGKEFLKDHTWKNRAIEMLEVIYGKP